MTEESACKHSNAPRLQDIHTLRTTLRLASLLSYRSNLLVTGTIPSPHVVRDEVVVRVLAEEHHTTHGWIAWTRNEMQVARSMGSISRSTTVTFGSLVSRHT